MHSITTHTEKKPVGIETLYKLFYAMLYVYALRRINCKQTAEDIVQQVFLNLMDKGIDVTAIENQRAYLLVMVRNELVSYLRREKLQKQVMSEAMWRSQHVTTHDKLQEKEYRKALQAAVDRLPEQRRKVFQLSFEWGMKSDEIAEELKIAKNTVRQQLKLARREVRSYVWRMVA